MGGRESGALVGCFVPADALILSSAARLEAMSDGTGARAGVGGAAEHWTGTELRR